MVYPVLDDPSILSHVYSVIFNMLDMLSLRYESHHPSAKPANSESSANLCQLLAMITKRKHVKPFRIQYLLVSIDVGLVANADLAQERSFPTRTANLL